MSEQEKKIEEILKRYDVTFYNSDGYIMDGLQKELSQLLTEAQEEAEKDTVNKLLASINSFFAENGIKDTDGTPLTFLCYEKTTSKEQNNESNA